VGYYWLISHACDINTLSTEDGGHMQDLVLPCIFLSDTTSHPACLVLSVPVQHMLLSSCMPYSTL
jgi:hypothetical protein